MMLGIQTVQESTRPHIITPPHKRVVVPEHEVYLDKIKTTQKQKPGHQLTSTTLFIRAPVSADATYRLGGRKRCHIKGDSPEPTALTPTPLKPVLTDPTPGS